MLPLILLIAAQQGPDIDRDAYGVPHIHAPTYGFAFYEAGYAVAQDRLWQMEMSRRLARGKLAEVFGKSMAASDREILATGYTDADLRQQYGRLSEKARTAIESYTEGVNAWIAKAEHQGLPEGYAKAGFKPEPWTELDSVAITVHLLQQFGRGGAGQLRNLAMLTYLKAQKPIGDRYLDVWDDMAWSNDPDAIPTLSPEDDPLAKSHYQFYQPDRRTSEAHLAKIPMPSFLELMSGIGMSSREVSTRVAENLSTPFHSGSYCIVVSPSRSATGHPLLLSGPQMGMRVPSIVHEMSIEGPGFSTSGMDVPGVPGVIIGETKSFAWGITSGVTDTDDIFYFPSTGATYQVGDESLPVEKIQRVLKVKGTPDTVVEQDRTTDGPVILTTNLAPLGERSARNEPGEGRKTIFTKKSSYWMHEMDTYDSWVSLWGAHTADEIEKSMLPATMNFNFFYATVGGDIGWRYLGLVPKRARGVDPRFPTPGDPKYTWQGFLSPAEMPHVRNPRVGFLANWNNKPVSWWPNFDTPTWGKIFQNSTLLATLQKPKLTSQDLEMSAWTIARTEETWHFFKPYIERAKDAPGYELIKGFDGKLIEGSPQASNYLAFLNELRKAIFMKTTGSFLSPQYFDMVLQPSFVLRALERRTKFNYLGESTPDQIVREALAQLAANPAPLYKAPTFPSGEATPIPYSNRGTYIQIIEFLKDGPHGRNVLPPGESESGPHQHDQSPLARAWLYKPMTFK